MSEKWNKADLLGDKGAEALSPAELTGVKGVEALSPAELTGVKGVEALSSAELTGVKGVEALSSAELTGDKVEKALSFAELLEDKAVTAETPPSDEPDVTATDDSLSKPTEKVGEDRRYTEQDVLRLASAVAARLSDGDGAARELEYLQLREELANEKRLRLLGENKLACIRALEAEGIPVAFADILVSEDRQGMEARLAIFTSAIRDWINREVSSKLHTLTPKPGDGEPGITKAQFRAMRVAEQQEIYRNNRPLYEELSR